MFPAANDGTAANDEGTATATNDGAATANDGAATVTNDWTAANETATATNDGTATGIFILIFRCNHVYICRNIVFPRSYICIHDIFHIQRDFKDNMVSKVQIIKLCEIKN